MTESLTKAELINSIAERTGSSKAATRRFLASLEEVVTEAIVEDKTVQLTGFVGFTPIEKPERTYRNPQTGEPVTVPATKSVKIKPLGNLKDAIESS